MEKMPDPKPSDPKRMPKLTPPREATLQKIRRINLLKLIDEQPGGTVTALLKRYGLSPSKQSGISRYVTSGVKTSTPLGYRAARQLEMQLGLDEGFFDRTDGIEWQLGQDDSPENYAYADGAENVASPVNPSTPLRTAIFTAGATPMYGSSEFYYADGRGPDGKIKQATPTPPAPPEEKSMGAPERLVSALAEVAGSVPAERREIVASLAAMVMSEPKSDLFATLLREELQKNIANKP